MGREIDESWIEEAIERYQQIEQLQGDFEKALARVEVTVHSPDGLVELAVSGGGEIRDVVISESAQGRSMRELSRAVHQAIMAAGDAAEWARAKVRQDVFGPAHELGAGFGADLGRTR
ncbi:MAG TPA: YbaB/EbfC family nucleoid-associated protein [Micromonosporaceae bacterium]